MRVENKYVPDMALGAGVYTSMRDSNIISPVIEQRVFNETNANAQLSYKKTHYNDWGNGIYQPSSIETALYSNSPTTELNFNGYSSQGNLLGYTGRGQSPVSYLWSKDHQYVTAECKNASPNEIFQDDFDEDISWNAGLTADAFSHSGQFSGRIDNTGPGKMMKHSNTWLTIAQGAPKVFRYSAWVYSNGPSADVYLFMKRPGETGYYSYFDWVNTDVMGKWIYVEKDFLVPGDVTQLNIRLDNNGYANGGGTVWFDNVRLHPAAAQMVSYTFKPMVGLTSVTDAKGQTNKYEYDIFNRLKQVKDQYGNILKQTDYHYQNQ
jgi:YD repeat-containing protein